MPFEDQYPQTMLNILLKHTDNFVRQFKICFQHRRNHGSRKQKSYWHGSRHWTPHISSGMVECYGFSPQAENN